VVLAYCGLRPGEALALRRRHLDDLGRLTVERGMTEHRGVRLERDTKTHRSRVVEVPASVLAELRTHVELRVGHDPAIFLRTYAHLYPGDLAAVAVAMDAARSAVVDAQQLGGEGTQRVRAPSSVARVDFAGMARRRRQEAERHGL
jgi:integrase